MNLFTNGMYEDARKKYESVKSCSKVEDMKKVDYQITLIDSIKLWRNLADSFFEQSDYVNAIEYFLKIHKENPKDNYIETRLSDARTKQREDCMLTFSMAESFFTERDYKNAQPLYEKVVGRSCNEMSLAIERLQEIRIKKQRPHALTYEFSHNTPIGLSTGYYKDHKSAGYFTIRLNPDLFELLRSEKDEELKPELNVSFGWTIKIIKPVWIFFGPGYTGVGQYSEKDNDSENAEGKKLTLKINHAVSPEVGLLGKIIIADKIGIALRYTYQYRFALEKEMQDYIGKERHIFGIGFCF